MQTGIFGFEGEYRFLSNFFPVKITFQEIEFPSVEHAFVAAKTTDRTLQLEASRIATPGQVKRFGRQLVLRQGWDDMRIAVMQELLILKFSQEPFTSLLLATGDAYLEETNHWNDKFWGVCNGEGENHLGCLLMLIRAELRNLIC